MAEQRDAILRYFAFAHLPDDLQDTSRQFSWLAEWIAANLPRNPERSVALRKLLEAREAALRAAEPEPEAEALEKLAKAVQPE